MSDIYQVIALLFKDAIPIAIAFALSAKVARTFLGAAFGKDLRI